MCLARADQRLRCVARRRPVQTTILCIYSNYVTSRIAAPTTRYEGARKSTSVTIGERMARPSLRVQSSSEFIESSQGVGL